MSRRDTYEGPALLSCGFRPFFLASILFGAMVIPLWWAVWTGRASLAGPFTPTDWHIHEMIFGYGAAVVAGFLFTAVPNWTGRLPTRGWPLAALLSLWIAGRASVAGLVPFPAAVVAAVDQSFLLAVALMIAREIVAGRNWRNLKILVPVSLLWLSNIAFHLEAAMWGAADDARRLGIALLIFLIMLIGGRILPSFTRNWLAARGASRLPVPFGRFDALSLAAGGAALFVWVVAPYSTICAALTLVAAAGHALRLSRWRGHATWRSPLLLMLHVSYLFIPCGFAGASLAALGAASPALPAHLFGIGAIGGMTVAVMMRAAKGHTGRDLVAGKALTVAFVLILLAVAARLADQVQSLAGVGGTSLAAAFWTLSFLLVAWKLAPVLTSRNVPRDRMKRA